MLNQLRKYWLIAALESSSAVGDDSLFILQFIFRFLRVVVLLSLWRVVFADPNTVAEFTLPALLTYTLIQEVFAEQLLPHTDIDWALHDGGIAMRFLQPLSLVSQFVSQMVGRWFLGFGLLSLPLLLLSPLLGVNPLPASLSAAGLFVISLLLTVAVGVALEFSFAALISYLEGSAYIVGRVRAALTLLLSGSVIPLALMPWGLGDILKWLPFASTASAPLQIYIGVGAPITLLLTQAAWAIVLWLLATWLWRVNRERLASYGG
jgi:ABC-2 type transport system permease protein